MGLTTAVARPLGLTCCCCCCGLHRLSPISALLLNTLDAELLLDLNGDPLMLLSVLFSALSLFALSCSSSSLFFSSSSSLFRFLSFSASSLRALASAWALRCRSRSSLCACERWNLRASRLVNFFPQSGLKHSMSLSPEPGEVAGGETLSPPPPPSSSSRLFSLPSSMA